MGINLCRECLKKQQRIDALLEENQRLKQKLKYQERKEKEGFFGSATSSAKVPVKANTAKPEAGKRKGAQRGHKGVGRKAFPEGEADRVVTGENSLGPQGPDCGRLLEEKGMEERLVIESQPLKAQRVQQGPVCHSVLLCPPFAGGRRPGKGVPRFPGGPGVCCHFHPPAYLGDGAAEPTALARAVSKESHPGSTSNPGGRRKPRPTSWHPTHSGYLPGKRIALIPLGRRPKCSRRK